MPETSITPVKSGISTSTFKFGLIVALLSPLIPLLHKAAENWLGTLPPESWLAYVMPGIVAAFTGLLRYLTMNGTRQAEARVAEAQAAVEIVKVAPVTPAVTVPDSTPAQTGVVLSDDGELQGTE